MDLLAKFKNNIRQRSFTITISICPMPNSVFKIQSNPLLESHSQATNPAPEPALGNGTTVGCNKCPHPFPFCPVT